MAKIEGWQRSRDAKTKDMAKTVSFAKITKSLAKIQRSGEL